MIKFIHLIAWIALVLSGCSSGEIIQFKGVPLDQPGAKAAMEVMCKDNTSNRGDTCTFKDRRVLIWLSYGTLSHHLGLLTFSATDELTQVEIKGPRAAMLAQVKVVSEKYGEPQKSVEQVSNGLGHKFDKEIFTWKDRKGARIQIESMYEKTDEGRLLIDSASSVKGQQAKEDVMRKAGQNNL